MSELSHRFEIDSISSANHAGRALVAGLALYAFDKLTQGAAFEAFDDGTTLPEIVALAGQSALASVFVVESLRGMYGSVVGNYRSQFGLYERSQSN
jgi:hypothetical protein